MKIFGEVQRVNFRYCTQGRAEEWGLTGWVRNTEDGAVECEAEGGEEALKEFLDWAKRGPSWAKVKKVEEKWKNFEGKFKKFEIRF